jgi:DNA helicase-2/ATP-dependent DNA helicase PcrA
VLSTIHRVKGLEWPMVVLHHADASQMPHRLADDVEEERRIFHVGLTRSVERCVVVGGADPSPFIAEMQVGRP